MAPVSFAAHSEKLSHSFDCITETQTHRIVEDFLLFITSNLKGEIIYSAGQILSLKYFKCRHFSTCSLVQSSR